MNRNDLKKEFIGLKVRITYNDFTFKGTIINETKNLIYIKTDNNQIKKIIKKNAKIFTMNQTIDGKTIIKRSEDRIKK
ncbi:ribonuclease P protein subunit [Candidatus Woesearchaeota archaeon]|nr:ribonuclease P protein subunit [Candidatus Woesearchaeota archaeon]